MTLVARLTVTTIVVNNLSKNSRNWRPKAPADNAGRFPVRQFGGATDWFIFGHLSVL
jgi:hypothetical protein